MERVRTDRVNKATCNLFPFFIYAEQKTGKVETSSQSCSSTTINYTHE